MSKIFSCPKCGKMLSWRYLIKGDASLDKKGKEMLAHCDSCNAEIILRQPISTQVSFGLCFVMTYGVGMFLIYTTDKSFVQVIAISATVGIVFLILYLLHYFIETKTTLK